MSVTSLPQSTNMSDVEWQTRCDLAAAYRLLHHYKMTDMVYTHLSARLADEPNTFLLNRYGDMFDEVTASNLVKMDMDGNIIGDAERFNLAGFNIHSGAYIVRPDVNCVMHTHTRAGVAVAATERGLLPISQHAMFIWNDVSHFEYSGPGSIEERDAMGKACSKSNCVVMRYHGLLTQGHTIQSAFFRMYYLEMSCQIQASAQAMNEPLHFAPPAVEKMSVDHYEKRLEADDLGQMEWQSLMRMLERQGVEYSC